MSDTTTTSENCGDELLGDFLDESTQLIERINARLMELDEWTRTETEGEVVDEALLNDMFRSAHSIKGLSAMLGLPGINGLTHNIENVFDAARRGDLAIDRKVVQVVYAAVDRLSEMVDYLREAQTDDLDCQHQLEAITQVLEAGGALKMQGEQDQVEAFFETPGAKPEGPPLQEDAPREPAGPSVTFVDCRGMFLGVTDEQDVPGKYLSIFLDETEMSLDEMVDLLLDFEAPQKLEIVRTLMITAHRIKGCAASIGLNRPAKLAHLMEDVLQRHGDASQPLCPILIDSILNCADGLRSYLKSLREATPVSDDFPALASELLTADALRGESPVVAGPAANAPTPLAAAGSVDRTQLVNLAAGRPSDDAVQLYVSRIVLNPSIPLVGLKAQLLCEKIARQGEVLLVQPPREELDAVERLGEVEVGFLSGLSAASLIALLNVSGVVDIQLDCWDAGASQWQSADGGSETEPVMVETPVTASEIEPASSAVVPGETAHPSKPADSTVAPPSAEPTAPVTASAEKVSLPVKAAPAASAPSTAAKSAAKPAETLAKPAETLRVDIERLDQLMNLAGQLVISKARFTQLGENLRDAVPHKQCQHWMDNTQAMCEKLLRQTENDEDRGSAKEVRELHGQIRKIQQQLGAISNEIRRVDAIRHGLTGFFDAVHQLDRVTDGIQKTIMETRMVPIGPLFGRFRRVVRDISRTNGKEIELEIHGEKTELDKRMIDELGDPLIHMVRNSADHGIETPADRLAAGKAAGGTITLNAFHRGNSIVIQVTDDGQGLSRERISRKAIEKGLITSVDAERMSDQQIYQLIWEPGFSTAEQVTEISGRGMGMDIVRAKIESINGAVEVDSRRGQGTVFTIKLPLTMAILPGLMTRIDGELYSIPVESIVEIVRLDGKDVQTIHGKRTSVVRGRPVSIVELNETFDWQRFSPRDNPRDGITIVIFQNDSREIGLVVDGILGEEDVVVKSLAENYRNVEGIAGACVLGNGRVALILDPAAVIDLAVRRQAGTVLAGTSAI